MKIILSFLIIMAICRPLAAEPVILVKGLTDHKAILSVDGVIVIIKKGEYKHNILLVEANNKEAILIINHKKVVLSLDKSISKSYSKVINKRKIQKVKVLFKESLYYRLKNTRIKEVDIVYQDHKTVQIKVDYFYGGEHGNNADVVVSVIKNGKAVKNIERQYHRLEIGHQTLDITFDMSKSKDIVFYTEAINLVFLGRKEKTFSFYSKTIDMEKYWKKVAVR